VAHCFEINGWNRRDLAVRLMTRENGLPREANIQA
jgi:hypothetical protein